MVTFRAQHLPLFVAPSCAVNRRLWIPAVEFEIPGRDGKPVSMSNQARGRVGYRIVSCRA
jgi:hypothetical protein